MSPPATFPSDDNLTSSSAKEQTFSNSNTESQRINKNTASLPNTKNSTLPPNYDYDDISSLASISSSSLASELNTINAKHITNNQSNNAGNKSNKSILDHQNTDSCSLNGEKFTKTITSNTIHTYKSTLSKILTDVKEAVQDDNMQTKEEESLNNNDLNRLLTKNFDLGDALRLESHNTDETINPEHLESGLEKTNTGYGSNLEEKIEPLKKVFTNKSTGKLKPPPEGGYGWICCICVTLTMFCTWGSNSGFGVFLAYYLNNDVFKGASKYDYAFIAGFTVFLGEAGAPFAAIVMKLVGLKIPMIIGCCIMFAGFLMAAYSTRLWELYLTQGVMIGIGMSFVFVPATTVLPGWFLKKRSFALGVSLIGTGAGGVTYSLSVNKLISDTGNQKWALIMLTISSTVGILIAIIFIKQHNPVKPMGLTKENIVKQFKIGFSLKIIKSYHVNIIAICFSLAIFGYNLMIFTLASYGISKGLSRHQASILTAVINAAQCFGRPGMGLLGDRLGRSNVTSLMTLLLCIFLFAFWITAHTFIQLIFFSICVGCCVGVANVMNAVLIADLVPPSDFSAAWGWMNLSSSPPLLFCEVVAQALTVPKHKDNPYLHTQIFAGFCFVAALLMSLLIREYTVRINLKQRLKNTNEQLDKYETSTIHHSKELEPSDKIVTNSRIDNNSLPNENNPLSCDLLYKRKNKYEYMLRPSVKSFIMRTFYPIKV
ncbi:related to Esbp6p [Saccharomycodes ludwigii]|uniref:Related to Esbp6p n=1 Tax=Saccharomycodes ludwigii TaxID=36035 RepID=A0A376B1K4_9ASCO|nr:hypothetical protein SCDLUD_002879 [Saccharomycodes ludwigii]KAH3901387.1 hypothetical protein SCDLUD_002879 [Saccharomycodes ludwigii]SSD58499.1 related to Esbp6p [Saccharomycodes ludwigii]